MISLAEINTAAIRYGVSAETIEKDYVISWILICLSKCDLKNKFIFYGGTAIKRVYFEDHRFSEDIDLFSDRKFQLDEILQELKALQYARELTNLTLQIDRDRISTTNNRIQLYISYPGYEEIIGAPKEIRVDFIMDMDLFGEQKQKEVIKSYSDLSIHNETLSVMTLNTILANKLGLLLDGTRNEPRDVYDIWFLLQRIKDFDFNLDKVIKAHYEKYSSRPTLTNIKTHLKREAISNSWEGRLKKQVTELPSINRVIEEIETKLKKLGF
jgi:predicted nucleotidyltransferase component of viral defense system